ncbi:protein PLANT CADMIUM RESISTANCE 2-like [Lycium ferocissimum]|uniref:protein PLANT CADMIUM RESISTANCE 2-like n=1 Tax=Lycium ferocissimum TaxID=112874 RepID=UPI00281585D1|nr:protein PLANT CADMIUM RESISTANCE 2-like [Lycium ferocissimum]
MNPSVYGEKPATGIPVAPEPWSTGICHCSSDTTTWCITCWCPCITFGQIAEIVDKGTTSSTTSAALYFLIGTFTGCACMYSCFYRTKMRKQFNLQGSTCGDCMLHFCCERRALRQEYRELQHRGFDMAIGWQENKESENKGIAMAPKVQEGMFRDGHSVGPIRF